jgi:acetyl esterase/lipase
MKRDMSDVHPELRPIAGMIPKFSFSSKNLKILRSLDHLQWVRKAPKDIFIENIFIPCPDHQTLIRLRIYRSKSIASSAPALIWLHGGGYIFGKPEQDDSCCIQYTRELGIVIVSVDYRYAPEHPFPAPLEDAYSALKWVGSHFDELGIDANRIAIGGASAGGGLAAALVQLVYDRAEISPIFQLLVYPMLDDRTCLCSEIIGYNSMVWTQASNRFGWESYLDQAYGAAELPAYSVPARRENLTGLPPAWIGVGTLDLFHDEDVAYARRLEEQGVACELVVIPGAFHGFDLAGQRLRVVRDFRQSQIAALRRNLFPGIGGRP